MKDSKCYNCVITGHTKVMCRKGTQANEVTSESQGHGREGTTGATQMVEAEDDSPVMWLMPVTAEPADHTSDDIHDRDRVRLVQCLEQYETLLNQLEDAATNIKTAAEATATEVEGRGEDAARSPDT